MPKRRAFTIIEIIVVLAIIGMMFAVIIPYFIVNHRKAEAGRVLRDLKALDAAVQRYALQTDRGPGTSPAFTDLVPFLDPGTDVFRNRGKDLLGNVYGPFTVGELPKVNLKTKYQFSGAVNDEFWSVYR